nr:MAG TPA: hypothetical protein [Caudoviricetes sp.]
MRRLFSSLRNARPPSRGKAVEFFVSRSAGCFYARSGKLCTESGRYRERFDSVISHRTPQTPYAANA